MTSSLENIPTAHQFELKEKNYPNGRKIKKVCVTDFNSSSITVKPFPIPGLASLPQHFVLSPFFVGKLAVKGMIIVISNEGKAINYQKSDPAIASLLLGQLK